MDLTKINGYEIIDFLNNLSDDDKDKLGYEYNLHTPFEFESQSIQDSAYILRFSCYYNNWGEDQIVKDNEIKITEDLKISVFLDEPLEGCGADSFIRKLLSGFIANHVFDDNVEEKYFGLIEEAMNTLNTLGVSQADKETLEQVIEKLTRAKSMIK